ncbi:MAG TPA: hypothetical protein VK186_06420 [Candidatus Deferrimicrobium sp.]|nr:hypothetical protein [Candidatus Deferrimicrobium sp.]
MEIKQKVAEIKARYDFRNEKNISMPGMPYWLEKRYDNTIWVSLRGKNDTIIQRVDEHGHPDGAGEAIKIEGFKYGAFTFHHDRLIAIRQGDIASFDMKGGNVHILRRIDNEKLTCIRFVPELQCFLLVNLSRQRLETLTEAGKTDVFFSYPVPSEGQVPLYAMSYWEQGRDYFHVIGLDNNRLLRIDRAGNRVASFTLTHRGGWFGLSEDNDGNLFLSNRDTAGIIKLDPAGEFIFSAGLSLIEQAACGIGFIALDREKHLLYVCDQKRNQVLLYRTGVNR